MAITYTVSNHAKYQFAAGQIDLANDSLKAILMDDSFAFNKDTHATLALVTANQLATKNGYTQNTKVLTTPSLAEDDTDDKGTLTCDDLTWTATATSCAAEF